MRSYCGDSYEAARNHPEPAGRQRKNARVTGVLNVVDRSSSETDDNLLTPELLGWLVDGERAAIGEYIYPYVYRAVMRFLIHRGLRGQEGEDLEGEAFLYVLKRLLKMYDDGGLHQFDAGLVYVMVRNCHAEKVRGRQGTEDQHVHYDATPVETLEHDSSFVDNGQIRHQRQFMTREALRTALSRLPAEDQDTLTLFEQHYFLCEDGADSETDLNDPNTIKALRASALKHLALSLHVNLSTVYRRLTRAAERLRELLDDSPGEE